jgi:phosphoglycerol transferase
MNEMRDVDPRPRATTIRISRPVQYAIVATVALVSAILVLKLWTVDLSIPLYYLDRRDTLTADSFMKGMIENGWFYQNDKLGAPLGSIAYDYPVFSLAHETIIRLILFVVPNPGFALNLFFVLGFPLTAITAYFVLCRLNIATIAAAVTSILYAFLPYRIWRNTSHLFYSSFYFVPLAVLVTLWVVRGESLFELSLGLRRRTVVRITKNGWLALLFCALISWDNQYHAFFTILLVFFATSVRISRNGSFGSIWTAFVLVGEIFVGLLINVVPNVIYHLKHAVGFTAPFIRFPKEAELYSLTLAQLVLPIAHHRLDWFAQIRDFYDRQFTTSINENSSVSLGLIASLGFIALLWNRLGRSPQNTRAARLRRDLAVLVLFSLLLGTFGGLGALFSYYINDNIRAYNRIAPFIGFLAFVNVALVFERLWIRFVAERKRAVSYGAAIAVIVLSVGILDQTAANSTPDPVRTANVFAEDRQFVERVEGSVAAGSSIYELPYVRFPEAGVTVNMPDYTEMIPYLHSRTLRWSYGAFATTEAGLWQEHLEQLPERRFLPTLLLAGFRGIFIFRDGYTDAGATIERSLSRATGVSPLVSANGHYSFFNLSDLERQTTRRLGGRFDAEQQATLHPVQANVGSGCSYAESSGLLRFHWCGRDATIELRNPMPERRNLHLSFTLATGFPTSTNMTMSSMAGSQTISVNSSGTTFSGNVDVPSGISKIHLHSDSPPIVALDDPRELVFQIRYFTAQDPLQPYPW